MNSYDPMFEKYICNIFFPRSMLQFLFAPLFFLANNTSKTLSFFLQVEFLISVDISKVYVMLFNTSQYSSAYLSFFNKEKTSVETETKLNFISYIWDDDNILRLDE